MTQTCRDAEFIQFWEYHELYYPQILKALKRVDRARSQLIAVQNNLVEVLRENNDYAKQKFSEFYAAGGVTAYDWQAYYTGGCHYPNKALISRGQLRMVHGGL